MPRIAIVGEAFGEQEELTGIPFLGAAGQELTRMLREVSIDRASCKLTNVLNFRPPNNDLRSICIDKASAVSAYALERPALAERHPAFPWPGHYHWPPLAGAGKFLHPRYLAELPRLVAELSGGNLDLVLALGNTACWALLNRSGIGKLRGYVYDSTLVPGLRVLPTYHPSSVLRQYSHRPIVIADLRKACGLVAGGGMAGAEPQNSKPPRKLWIEPEAGDLRLWWSAFVPDKYTSLAVDIETFGGTITCIGFGTETGAISIPFWDRRKPDGNYWNSGADEELVLAEVKSWLLSPNPKIFQNGLYDLQYIWKTWGMVVHGSIEDTMLMHHALQPEMSKDLNFLGSVYSTLPAWKYARKQASLKLKAEKRDE